MRMVTFGFKNAQVEFISDNALKVTVQKGKFFEAFSGSFAYLYSITPYGFWQSHPFTVLGSVHNHNEISMFIKAKKGTTKYIKNKCVTEGGKTTIRISLEGPHGHHAPTQKDDTALLLADVNRIPGPSFHARDLAKKNSRQQTKLL